METPLTVSESQDGNVPKSLTDIIYSLQGLVGIPNRNQLISGLFYLLMQECGYELMQPAECDDSIRKDHKDFDGIEKRMMTFNLNRLLTQASLVAPLLASSNGPYKLPLKLVGVQDYKFQLLISPSADDLIVVNLLVKKEDIEDCFSIALRVSTFVPYPKSDDIGRKFADLKTLSVIFKDNIAHRGRSAVLNAEGIVNNSLVGLMDEVKHKIVKVLPVNDLLNLSSTCQSMLTLKRNQSVWKALLWRDFHHKVSEDEDQSVDNLISIYKRLRDESRFLKTRWMQEIDESFMEDDISVDAYVEYQAISRESSFDFHPYFIMNIHNELRTTNAISLPPIQSAMLISDYESHTHIPNSRCTETNESSKP